MTCHVCHHSFGSIKLYQDATKSTGIQHATIFQDFEHKADYSLPKLSSSRNYPLTKCAAMNSAGENSIQQDERRKRIPGHEVTLDHLDAQDLGSLQVYEGFNGIERTPEQYNMDTSDCSEPAKQDIGVCRVGETVEAKDT